MSHKELKNINFCQMPLIFNLEYQLATTNQISCKFSIRKDLKKITDF